MVDPPAGPEVGGGLPGEERQELRLLGRGVQGDGRHAWAQGAGYRIQEAKCKMQDARYNMQVYDANV